MAVKWVDHRGHHIMYLDCRNKAAEELITLLDEAAELLEASPEKVRVLANVEETFLTSEFMSRMRTLGKEVFSRKVKKTSIVGVTGLKTVLLNTYNFLVGRNMTQHKTEAAALEWLSE